MEPLQKQVVTLGNKVDALYQVIQQLEHKVSQALSTCTVDKTTVRDNLLDSDTGSYQLKGHISFSSEMEHKDVLVDGIYPDLSIQGGDKHLTSEIQIQRLTAQLTAAYNRIAALEEQLLLKRINS
jgi:cytochrome b involved in lipid metabolism